MIFKQVQEIIEGRKTQTRRVFKATEWYTEDCDFPGRISSVYTIARNYIKWQAGRTYAVVPKRGAPTYIHNGQPLRIRLASIRQQFLTEITEDDARAEGVASVAEYRALWESINGKTPGARWADNPLVWVLTFEVVR